MLPRHGEDVPHTEQFSTVLTESKLTQQRRANAVSATISDTGNVVDQQEQRSHIVAARNTNGTGEGGGTDHITSNFLLWSKEALRKAIIDTGYTGSGLKNKVLPVKAVMLNLYRTHDVLRDHASPIDTVSSSTAVAATVAPDAGAEGQGGQLVETLSETTTSNDDDINETGVNDDESTEEGDDDLSQHTKRSRHHYNSTRYGPKYFSLGITTCCLSLIIL